MDLIISGPATSVLFVLILVCNSQWHTPDRKNLKPAVKEFDYGHGLRDAIVIFFRRVHVELI